MKCLICDTPIKYSGRGRPPTYCSKPCKRSAEYEIRRIQRRLIKLETRLEELKAEPYTWAAEFGIPKIDRLIKAAVARLHQLVS